jgi:hypothetical protein
VKTKFIEDIGIIHFTRRKNAKRIIAKFYPDQTIRVTIPYYSSYKQAISFLHENKKEIKQKLEKASEKQKKISEGNFRGTKEHKLKLIPEDRKNPSAELTDSHIIIRYPFQTNVYNPSVQETIRSGITKALRKEARVCLPEKVKELAKEHSFSYNRIFLKNAKTIWGSCSNKKNINLNIHLMKLPDHLIDFVILHELCHTVHPNHSEKFWDLLQSFYQTDIRKLRQELKNYNTQSY